MPTRWASIQHNSLHYDAIRKNTLQPVLTTLPSARLIIIKPFDKTNKAIHVLVEKQSAKYIIGQSKRKKCLWPPRSSLWRLKLRKGVGRWAHVFLIEQQNSYLARMSSKH